MAVDNHPLLKRLLGLVIDEDQMARNWYVAEVGDVKALRGLLTSLRNVDGVFDARRVTPS